MYQKSLNNARKDKGSYKTHFNDKSNEATTSRKISEKVEMPNLTITNYMDMENMIIEYYLNDVFRILTRLPLSL
jgi:hypothetical protein